MNKFLVVYGVLRGFFESVFTDQTVCIAWSVSVAVGTLGPPLSANRERGSPSCRWHNPTIRPVFVTTAAVSVHISLRHRFIIKFSFSSSNRSFFWFILYSLHNVVVFTPGVFQTFCYGNVGFGYASWISFYRSVQSNRHSQVASEALKLTDCVLASPFTSAERFESILSI